MPRETKKTPFPWIESTGDFSDKYKRIYYVMMRYITTDNKNIYLILPRPHPKSF